MKETGQVNECQQRLWHDALMAVLRLHSLLAEGLHHCSEADLPAGGEGLCPLCGEGLTWKWSLEREAVAFECSRPGCIQHQEWLLRLKLPLRR